MHYRDNNIMSQASILKYYSKRTAPLLPPCSRRVGHAPPAKKRCVGRPRKVKRNSPAPETDEMKMGKRKAVKKCRWEKKTGKV